MQAFCQAVDRIKHLSSLWILTINRWLVGEIFKSGGVSLTSVQVIASTPEGHRYQRVNKWLDRMSCIKMRYSTAKRVSDDSYRSKRKGWFKVEKSAEKRSLDIDLLIGTSRYSPRQSIAYTIRAIEMESNIKR